MMNRDEIRFLLVQIYGEAVGAAVYPRLLQVLDQYRSRIPEPKVKNLSQQDAVLITYPDQISEADKSPLECLADFCEHHVEGVVTGLHILPFYPSSSDDGFSVVDYRAVEPQYEGWS